MADAYSGSDDGDNFIRPSDQQIQRPNVLDGFEREVITRMSSLCLQKLRERR